MSLRSWPTAFLIPLDAWRLRRELRNSFQQRRQERLQADEEFMNSIVSQSNDFDRKTAITIRKLIALQCGVPAEYLRDDDKTTELQALTGQSGIVDFILAIPDGLDFSGFYLRLEKDMTARSGCVQHIALSVRENARRLWSAGDYDFGRWTAWLIGKSRRQQ